MKLVTYFNDFLSEIRLTTNQSKDLKTGHTTLRTRLLEDEDLSSLIVTTFLQGSYRRATAVRPKGESRSDVDVIVVTNLNKDDNSPQEALDLFVPFLEKHYKGKWKMQGRSLGIELSYVELDLVITSAPLESQKDLLMSESVTTEENLEEIPQWSLSKSWSFNSVQAESEDEWKSEPLLIPDRDAEEWKPTDPLAQIKWTRDKNKRCNGHYINVVKALKWWRKLNPTPKYPKGYPLEHLIGQCCPDRITSIAEGITLTLENIITEHSIKPFLPDHGVPEHDVFGRISDEEYKDFLVLVDNAYKIAAAALEINNVRESAIEWKKLFGSKFPDPPTNNSNSFTPRTESSQVITGGRFGK